MSDDYRNQDNGLLFKFMPFNLFALQTIVNNSLYFNKPDLLNDPLDCRFEIDIRNIENFSRSTVEQIRQRRPFLVQNLDLQTRNVMLYQNQALQKKFLDDFFKFDFNDNYGICSFSQTINETLLWSHYADRTKGICIAFNKQKLIDSLVLYCDHSFYRCEHGPVRYNGVKKLSIRLFKNHGLSYSKRHLYSKTKHWSYEKEFRIVLRKILKPTFTFSYPQDFIRTIHFSKDAIHSIILGEKIDAQNEKLLFQIIQNGNLDIPIKQYLFQ